MYVIVYALIAYSALEKQHPDLNFQSGPNFSKISVRADQNFQRKFWSRTKYFRTKIPVTAYPCNKMRGGGGGGGEYFN